MNKSDLNTTTSFYIINAQGTINTGSVDSDFPVDATISGVSDHISSEDFETIKKIDRNDLEYGLSKISIKVKFSEKLTGWDRIDLGKYGYVPNITATYGLNPKFKTSRSVSSGGHPFTISVAPNDGPEGFGRNLQADQSIDSTKEFLNFSGVIKTEQLVKAINLLDVQEPTTCKFSKSTLVTIKTGMLNTDSLDVEIDKFLEMLLGFVTNGDLYQVNSALIDFLKDDTGIADEQSATTADSMINFYKKLSKLPNTNKENMALLIDWWIYKKKVLQLYQKRLQAYLNMIALDNDDVQSNINNKTNFGNFASKFKKAMHILAPSWVNNASSTAKIRKKQNTAIKEETLAQKAASKTILEQSQSDLDSKVKIALVNNQIISKVDGTGTSIFVGGLNNDTGKGQLQAFNHQDYTQVMSVLDILRDEYPATPVDSSTDTQSNATAEALPNSDEICKKLILQLPDFVVTGLIEGLTAEAVKKAKEIGDKISDLAKLSRSDTFTLATTYSGIEKMFPLNLVAETAFFVSAGFEYFPKIDFGNLKSDLQTAISEVGDFSIDRAWNTAQMLAGGLLDEGKNATFLGIHLTYDNIKQAKKSASDLVDAFNCKNMSDAKEILSNPKRYTGELEKIKTSFTNVLKEYQTHVELLEKLTSEKEQIERLVTSIKTISDAKNIPGAALGQLGIAQSAERSIEALNATTKERGKPSSVINDNSQIVNKLMSATPGKTKVQ